MRERFAYAALAAALTAVVGASLLPPGSTGISQAVNNLLHLPVYGAVGLLACWALRPWADSPRRRLVAVLAVVGLASWLVEGLQPLVGRSASLKDLGMNLLGALLAWLAWYAVGGARERLGRRMSAPAPRG